MNAHRARRISAYCAVLVTVIAATLTAVLVTAGPADAAGTFAQVSNFGSNPGSLNMYSYLPAGLPGNAPLVVALHGCTQSANDYYSHSGWSKYADLYGFAVVFPEQPSSTNPVLECFDWGTPSDDSRGQGEALSIYQMAQYAQAHYGVDPHRIYITGLSAGAGMTSDLLADYPDVFAAGSIDSGLPLPVAYRAVSRPQRGVAIASTGRYVDPPSHGRNAVIMESIYDHAGGDAALHRLEEIFYDKVLTDPVLKQQFRSRVPTHVDHLTAFTAESFGGPDGFTRELGFRHIIDAHRHLKITDEQRERFVTVYLQALEEAGLPDDEPFREAVRSHAEFGSRVAQQNSWAETDAELHPIREVPRWQWPDAST